MNFPAIDPYIFQLNIPFLNFTLRPSWYGFMYVCAFGAFYFLSLQRRERYGWSQKEVSDYLTYIMFGVVLGGRIGYCVFPYGWEHWSRDWTYIFRIWQGGMSFHGGLLGVVVASWLFARKSQRSFWAVADFVSMSAATGLFCGRLGNFINGELWGRTTDVPWAMIFPGAGPQPRHPSQLYEAFFEGIVLFLIMWCYTAKPKPLGRPSGLFLLGYGLFRSAIEFFREPDAQLSYYFHWLTMGQILSLPMIVIGAYLLWRPLPPTSSPSAS